MRLRSEIWVKHYLRICQARLIHAVVLRHGDDDAGAIYIKVNCLDGSAKLFSPAPSISHERTPCQTWMAHMHDNGNEEKIVDDFLNKQVQFDPDLWIVEVEDKHGRHYLDEWLK
ncbi:MAG: hypothetical protein TECD_00655 [Hyphomicrobiaceae bacterium hypho_1]